MFQTITANRNGIQRREQLDGREYIVTPVRMIVPGVLVGNRGALLYSKYDIRKSVSAWNGMPIVVNHPKRDDRYVSARQPDVLQQTGVGFVFNVSDSSGNLDGEAWIDIQKLRRVDPQLAARAERGEKVEVSTGLGTENEPESGTYQGKPYTHRARNFAPDHLALLPSERGACSLDDGCGLSVNEMKSLVKAYEESGTTKTFSVWSRTQDTECKCHGKCQKCKKDKMTTNFQPVANAEDGVWRTTEGGTKIYIKDGITYAGGPKGKVLDGGKSKESKKDSKLGKSTSPKPQSPYSGLSKDLATGPTVGGLNNAFSKVEGKPMKTSDVEAIISKLKKGDEVNIVYKELTKDGSKGKSVTGIVSSFGTVKGTTKKAAVLENVKGDMPVGPNGKFVLNPLSSIHGITWPSTKMTTNFQPTTNVQRSWNFQPTVNADGIWRTPEDGSKIFIKDGKAYAGGPNGKALGGKGLGGSDTKKENKGKSHIQGVDLPIKSENDFRQQAEKSGLTVKKPITLPSGETNDGTWLVAKDKEGNTVGEFHKKLSKSEAADKPSSSEKSSGKSNLSPQQAIMKALDSGKVSESDFNKHNTGAQKAESKEYTVGQKVKIGKNYGGGLGYVVGFNKDGSFALVKKGKNVESYQSTDLTLDKS